MRPPRTDLPVRPEKGRSFSAPTGGEMTRGYTVMLELLAPTHPRRRQRATDLVGLSRLALSKKGS